MNFNSETNARAHRTPLTQNILSFQGSVGPVKMKNIHEFKLEGVWGMITKELELYLNLKVSLIIQSLQCFLLDRYTRSKF